MIYKENGQEIEIFVIKNSYKIVQVIKIRIFKVIERYKKAQGTLGGVGG
jgi:hypothetical protein